MSVDALKAFSKKCVENEDMKKRCKEIGLTDIDGLVAYGKEQGFDFSEKDFAALGKEAEASGELSVADLEHVAGGFVTGTAVTLGVVVAAVGVGAGVGVAGTTATGTVAW